MYGIDIFLKVNKMYLFNNIAVLSGSNITISEIQLKYYKYKTEIIKKSKDAWDFSTFIVKNVFYGDRSVPFGIY